LPLERKTERETGEREKERTRENIGTFVKSVWALPADGSVERKRESEKQREREKEKETKGENK